MQTKPSEHPFHSWLWMCLVLIVASFLTLGIWTSSSSPPVGDATGIITQSAQVGVSPQISLTVSPTSSLARTYNNNILVNEKAETEKTVVVDYLGSVRFSTNDQSIVESSIDFDPFGVSIRHSSELNDNQELGFQSKVYDDKTGFWQFVQREYAASRARFIQVDKIVGEESYSFVSNNPLRYVDPDGAQKKTYGIYWYAVNRAHVGDALNNINEILTGDSRLHLTQTAQGADIVVASGHHGRGPYLYGYKDPNDVDSYQQLNYVDLPKSTTARVCALSACSTVSDISMNDGMPGVVYDLLTRYPNLRLIVGYQSMAPTDDKGLWDAFAKVAPSYLDKNDLKGLAEWWEKEGPLQLKEYELERTSNPPRRLLVAYYKQKEKENKWVRPHSFLLGFIEPPLIPKQHIDVAK